MTDSYSFQGGTFDPVEQVDVMPEQEKDNALKMFKNLLNLLKIRIF